ncbi:hypothetical protein [Capnocytophaga sputigena]|jgi:hypothetical protein|uniref:hypothetical protein n=1 Tax=Capnocytophaga sputigena TaxID=1019 RepID=UPI00248E4FC6|nr:hypothetical protein [Capnocytophaga sputigena]
MMDVLYYYIYLFYVKVISDNQPHSNTIWALGFLFSLIINFSLDMGLAFFFGYTLSVFQMVSIAALLMLLFYFKYYKSGRGKQIVKKEKPKFFGSNTASIILTVLFFLISMLFLFFKVEVMIKILEMNKVTASPM